MKVIEQSFKIIGDIDGQKTLRHIEKCGRVCYKSEGKIGENTADGFVRSILRRGHESVIEHISVTADIITDRGVTHELVRHRIASYSQESTRYCNYSGDRFGSEITVIRPIFLTPGTSKYYRWRLACESAERDYMDMLTNYGYTPQEARTVLPNSLKAEIMATMNLREWRHFFALRCAPAAHPQMRQLALMGLKEMHEAIPAIFDDLAEQFLKA